MELQRLLYANNDDVRVQLPSGEWIQESVSAYDEHGITLQADDNDEAVYVPWTSVMQLRFVPALNDYDVAHSVG